MRDIRSPRRTPDEEWPPPPPPAEPVSDSGPAPRPAPKSAPVLPKKFTGSSVPVTNVHVPTNQAPPAPVDYVPPRPEPRQPQSSPPVAKQPRANSPRLGNRERKVLAALFVLIAVIAGLAAVLFLPKADVQLVLRTAPLLVDQTLTVRAGETTAFDEIPGNAFFREVSLTGTQPVTSTEVVGTKATGTVEIVNRTIEQQAIKEGSRLVTDDGNLFYMQRHVIVPPAAGNTPARATVAVEADLAGEDGNITPQRLDFAALDEASQQLVYAEATQALTGGSGETVKVIKEADLTAARQAAADQAKAQAEVEIRAELPPEQTVLEESWETELTEFTTEAALDDQAEAIFYEARIMVRVMGYQQDVLEERLRTALEERLEEAFALFPSPISFTKRIEAVNWDSGEATMVARVTHTTIPDLSLPTLRQKLAGRSRVEAQTYLEGLAGVRSVTIDLWPFWVTSIPRIEGRIELDLAPERPL